MASAIIQYQNKSIVSLVVYKQYICVVKVLFKVETGGGRIEKRS